MKETLDKLTGLRAIVVGDIILDSYIWGDATRISPEAPVPVVDIERDSFTAGGAANVACNIRALGAKVEVCGWIGDDAPGKQLISLFADKGVKFHDEVFVTADVPTIQKTRIMVQNQQLCRLDREPAPSQYAGGAEACTDAILESVAPCDVVILSDYAKGFLSNELIGSIVAAARHAGKLVALDPKPIRQLKLKGLDLMTPNMREALKLANVSLGKHEPFPAKAVCDSIWEKYHPKYLVVTMGAEGMMLCESGKITEKIPTVAREVYDVSGAGDTIVSALSLALAAGSSLVDAAHLANAAAGVVVGKVGTATATPEEILEHVET
jgi:rfaE bifunctional protein kinase chain/domain